MGNELYEERLARAPKHFFLKKQRFLLNATLHLEHMSTSLKTGKTVFTPKHFINREEIAIYHPTADDESLSEDNLKYPIVITDIIAYSQNNLKDQQQLDVVCVNGQGGFGKHIVDDCNDKSFFKT
uniref:Uncharacterized protein n=1 Tax=Glossina pallidipes TaxID=7398 RepID=A0A1A9ZGC3_GLOPL